MTWFHIDLESWTVGIEADRNSITLHLGPFKLAYIKRGTDLYRDFQRIRQGRK
jgi:hypothetical protein